MLTWNAAIVILVVLLYSRQVFFAMPTITSKTIDYRKMLLLVGRNHYDESTLLYALCKNDVVTARCTVYLKSEEFDDTFSCRAHASSQLGKINLLGVELWGVDKALFLWRDVNTNNERQGELYVEELHMRNCFSKVNHFSINIRPDKRQQEYVITSQSNYLVTFLNQHRCFNHMCNVTVDIYGHTSPVQPWIPGTNFIYTLESIDYSSKNLLISIAEPFQNSAEIYLLNGNTKQFLTSFEYAPLIGWSSSNGIILFCYLRICKRYNLAGEFISERAFSREIMLPTKYVAIYNLPDEGLLALVCFREENSVYQIIQIQDGTLVYKYSLNNLNSSHNCLYMTGKFYEKGSREYCLSLFYATDRSEAKFVSHCFFLPNI